MSLFEGERPVTSETPDIRVIGQVYDTYWMFEYEDKLMIMDQHAAHEKVLFERFRKEWENSKVAS